MSEFTPVSALVGGVAIGGAAALLWLGLGRIAGVSGILAGMLAPARGEWPWRAAFLIGLPVGTALYAGLGGDTGIRITGDTSLLLAGGFLVGLGTRVGSGCTSGHGVCGLARGSRRSAVATATFMITGAVTVFALRSLAGS